MLYQAAATTGTFRLKAMLLYLREKRGLSPAKQFAERIGGGAIFDDETRPLARALWVRALEEFARIAGESALRELAPFLVRAENLGAWARVLRGASSPDRIYEQMSDGTEGLPGDSLIRMEPTGPRAWVGRIDWSSQESQREKHLIELAQCAELAAVPLLLGYGEAQVRVAARSPTHLALRVEWREPGHLPLWLAGGIALGLLLLAWSGFGASLWFAGLDPLIRRVMIWLPPAFVLLLGYLLQRDLLRQADSTLQRVRILALEREAALRQTRSKEISRPHEEPIIAGQYRVGVQLGAGGTGAVWQAVRLPDRKIVALKLLRTAVVHDVRASDRLRREAEALGLAWHPNVVEVYDSGLLPSGVGFLVMECLRGETLAERLHRTGPLDAPTTLHIGLQTADALMAVHSAGVVHRDIKPGNLYLHRPGEDPEILKLIDFGVAKVSWAETRLTRSGVRIGTLGYASPEQEEGADVDGRSDIYGLGITLRECLTGVAPKAPGKQDEEEILVRIEEPLRSVIRKATALSADHRYSTVREFKEALEGVTQRLLRGDAEGAST